MIVILEFVGSWVLYCGSLEEDMLFMRRCEIWLSNTVLMNLSSRLSLLGFLQRVFTFNDNVVWKHETYNITRKLPRLIHQLQIG
jgi:hypothetical protein